MAVQTGLCQACSKTILFVFSFIIGTCVYVYSFLQILQFMELHKVRMHLAYVPFHEKTCLSGFQCDQHILDCEATNDG